MKLTYLEMQLSDGSLRSAEYTRPPMPQEVLSPLAPNFASRNHLPGLVGRHLPRLQILGHAAGNSVPREHARAGPQISAGSPPICGANRSNPRASPPASEEEFYSMFPDPGRVIRRVLFIHPAVFVGRGSTERARKGFSYNLTSLRPCP